MMMKKRIIFTTLAVYQTEFWLAVALKLRDLGHPVSFISFDDCSSELIKDEGFLVLSLNWPNDSGSVSEKEIPFKKLGIQNPNLYTSHERFSFGLRSSDEINAKFKYYFYASFDFLVELARNEKVVVVQELGGFISVLSVFEAVRASGLNNIFVEPSFFKGRQFFLKNTLSAKKIKSADLDTAALENIEKVLNNTIANKKIVVPYKDRKHYSAAAAKVFNFGNAIRLFKKLINQYLFRKHYEFGYPIRHAYLHFRMMVNSLRLRHNYKSLDGLRRFIYFPLHVPGDVALTLRSPQFLDQLALIDYLARNLPQGFDLVIKEHPAQIGALGTDPIRELLNRYDYLFLLDPTINNFDVLGKASCVVSINSKSGAEALLFNCPVIVLGDSFYSESELVYRLRDISKFNELSSDVLASKKTIPHDVVIKFFANVWANSSPGELYSLLPDDVDNFVSSISKVVQRK
ncbi:MAG: capsule biosynthesis protein [Flavobacteriaceae bacterium]|nr:capsule biosynthesis protein [Flavobacteriaceae bacterium]